MLFIFNVHLHSILPVCSPYCRKNWWTQLAGVMFVGSSPSHLPRRRCVDLCHCHRHHRAWNDRRGRPQLRLLQPNVVAEASTIGLTRFVITGVLVASVSVVEKSGLVTISTLKLFNFTSFKNSGKSAMVMSVKRMRRVLKRSLQMLKFV
jgi:hypothetical protein